LLADSDKWIIVSVTGKRKSAVEELLRRGSGCPAGSKNNPIVNRERAGSRSI
jgi:hypothetical protein